MCDLFCSLCCSSESCRIKTNAFQKRGNGTATEKNRMQMPVTDVTFEHDSSRAWLSVRPEVGSSGSWPQWSQAWPSQSPGENWTVPPRVLQQCTGGCLNFINNTVHALKSIYNWRRYMWECLAGRIQPWALLTISQHGTPNWKGTDSKSTVTWCQRASAACPRPWGRTTAPQSATLILKQQLPEVTAVN